MMSLSRLGYGLGHSIADLVDNGIDEGAKNVEILIHDGDSEDDLFIAIFDNGTGIPEKFDKIMNLDTNKSDATKLEFLELALNSHLYLMDEVTIVSKHENNTPSIRRISAPYIYKHNENKILKYPVSN